MNIKANSAIRLLSGASRKHRRLDALYPPLPAPLAFLPLVLLWLCLGALPCAGADTPYATGITKAVNDVILSASVPGIVSAWHFKEGDFVKSNAPIIELDKQLEQLEVTRRKLAMDILKVQLDSTRKLVSEGSISVTKEQLAKAESDYKIAAVEYDVATEQLRRRTVFAPCDGFIAEITKEPGEACQAYEPLVRLVDTRHCYFICNVEAKSAAKLKLNQVVKLELEAGAADPLSIQGKIVFLSPVVDSASGLERVKALFENPDGKVHPGIDGQMYLQ
jgi:membrane fusion protein, multidrug efflux system